MDNMCGKALLLLVCFGIFFSCNEQPDEIASRPNILIAIGDDISFPHMSAYGCQWVQTPSFDKVAREGLLFSQAYTPNAKCSPSRAIILTGRNSWQLEEAANHVPFFPAKFKTVFEALAESGYHTGYTGKGYAPGNPGVKNGKPRELVGPVYSKLKLTPPTSGISSIDYSSNFEDFLASSDEDAPFMFWYGSLEPHRSFEYGTGQSLGGKELEDIQEVFDFWPDHDSVRNDILDYAFEIEWFDRHLGKMISILEEKGELANTLIIVTADNGMAFPRIKGQSYFHSNHMPLAMMWGDGIKDPGRLIKDYVSFADFAPTLIELAGMNRGESEMAEMEGVSLVEIFENRELSSKRDFVLVGKERHDIGRPNDVGYPMRGILKGDFLLIRNFKNDRWPSGDPITGYLNTDASPTKSVILHDRRSNGASDYWDLNFGKRPEIELYNVIADPDCSSNLAGMVEYKSIQDELSKILIEELTRQEDPRMLGNGDRFDRYKYAQDNHRDFYNRFLRGEIEARSARWVIEDDFEKDNLEIND